MSNTVGREERKYTSKEVGKIIDECADEYNDWGDSVISIKELKQKMGLIK